MNYQLHFLALSIAPSFATFNDKYAGHAIHNISSMALSINEMSQPATFPALKYFGFFYLKNEKNGVE
jgi:hypothetical protein